MMKAKVRYQPNQRMNKTEARFAQEVLDQDPDILKYRFEAIKLRLANKTWYTPDFVVYYSDSIHIYEVKGFWRDDARVKLKVAAEQFPEFDWEAVTLKRGVWAYEQF